MTKRHQKFEPTSRNIPVISGQTALLFIDTQNYNCQQTGGQYADMSRDQLETRYGYFFGQLEGHVFENWVRLQSAFRASGEEVLYTVMESLTLDGRDRSLDYKITGFNIPKGSHDGKVLDIIAPGFDEIVLPKTSSSVFMSTNIDYLLRNLQIRSLVLAGVLTDQCIDSAVRDACDLGYLVTVIHDACATHTEERHRSSLANNAGYCRQISTNEMLEELEAAKEGN